MTEDSHSKHRFPIRAKIVIPILILSLIYFVGAQVILYNDRIKMQQQHEHQQINQSNSSS